MKTSLLLCEPSFFDVQYTINPYMQGQIGNIDKELAYKQWEEIKNLYINLGLEVKVISGRPKLLDMVFCANTFVTFIKDNKVHALLSNMHSKFREEETIHTENWLKAQNIEVISLPKELKFEGTGDAIRNFHTDKLYIGHGYRTSLKAIQKIQEYLPHAIPLELITENFYHLDTCFAVLSKDTAVYVKEAFSDTSLKILEKEFSNLIRIDLKEAKKNFAANLFCPDGRNIIIQKGAHSLLEKLQDFTIHEVETGEFMKSGGSVFCMKNQYHA